MSGRSGLTSPGGVALWVCLMLLSLLMSETPAANAQCSCPFPGDIDGNGMITVLELTMTIDEIYYAGPPSPQDPNCPVRRSDFNADGIVDVLDLTAYVERIFFANATPQPPCDCVANPSLCDPDVDPNPGAPGNSVVVESKSVYDGESGVPIHIYLTNSVTVRDIVLPLVAREITPGSFITAAQGKFRDRVDAAAQMYGTFSQYADLDGECLNGSAGGFQMPAYNDTNSYHPVTASPEGFQFATGYFFAPYLAPGADASGSMVLNVDVTSTVGAFEIDTTCTNPGNHLLFVADGGSTFSPVVPAFTKGVISIVANQAPVAQCLDATVSTGAGCDADASIDNGSYDPEGGPVIITQDPPGPYPVGTTPVTLNIEDERGAISSCQANVTVEDNTPPVITCPNDTVINVPPVHTGAVVAYTVDAVDNCGGAVTIDANFPSGGFIPEGINEVIVTATDAAGNTSQCSFYVTIMAVCFDRLADINCDGMTDAIDLAELIDMVFFGAPDPPPCTSDPNF